MRRASARTVSASSAGSPVVRRTMNGDDRRALQIVDVHLRLRHFLEAAVTDVADHADDRRPRTGRRSDPMRTCWPIGSWFGNSLRAIVSLITATGGAVAPSLGSKPRPRRIGMPIVCEVVVHRAAELHFGQLGGRHRPAFDLHRRRHRRAAERHARGAADRDDAGQRFHAREEVPVEREAIGVVGQMLRQVHLPGQQLRRSRSRD